MYLCNLNVGVKEASIPSWL